MDQAQIAQRVSEAFGDRIVERYEFRGQHAVTIRPGTLRDLLTWLRDTPGLQFEWLMDIGGVDYLGYGDEDREWRFEVVYQVYSMALNHRFRVKVAVNETESIPTVWDLWAIANWEEREVWDMYGIRFDGHPNLRRILNHDEFQGYPLRKDYPINRRQKLSAPTENILCERPELA